MEIIIMRKKIEIVKSRFGYSNYKKTWGNKEK